jgi:hypothetical protein
VPDDKIRSLGRFVDRVRETRKDWGVLKHKELWFRGEKEKYETPLCPTLYRSPKPPQQLLGIENDLYDYFQRCGAPLCDATLEEDSRDWDWYFLMQHHGAPTRLLDWSDGALLALHIALRNKAENTGDAFVYVLEPDQLQEEIKALSEILIVKKEWSDYVKRHPAYGHDDDEWEWAWLPDDKEGRDEVHIPPMPLLLKFPHITRRVAAQRSHFILFGTEPAWLSDQLAKKHQRLETITIEANSVASIRVELRESGVTESVVFPDLDGLGREVDQLWRERK